MSKDQQREQLYFLASYKTMHITKFWRNYNFSKIAKDSVRNIGIQTFYTKYMLEL